MPNLDPVELLADVDSHGASDRLPDLGTALVAYALDQAAGGQGLGPFVGGQRDELRPVRRDQALAYGARELNLGEFRAAKAALEKRPARRGRRYAGARPSTSFPS